MAHCFFASDLHGHPDRYEKLFGRIAERRPDIVFLGGDLLPGFQGTLRSFDAGHTDFVNGFLAAGFEKLRAQLGPDYPAVFLILGNDDARIEEAAFLDAASTGLWTYAHNRSLLFRDYRILGYACIPPSPFLLKDWERYDVSRYVEPGSVSPEEGYRTVPVSPDELRHTTIAKDLENLTHGQDLSKAVCLFHAPPYQTKLDRAGLDGRMIEHVPLDPHIGSVAVRRFIEERQPLVTLHGHVHESARLSGEWRDRIGRTYVFSAAHDGKELALVELDLENPEAAQRLLL